MKLTWIKKAPGAAARLATVSAERVREELLKLGLSPGPRLGALLAEIREKQLQDELTTREAALAWVKGQC